MLRAIIGRDGAELSATETLREEMDAPERLDHLVPQYVHAVEVMTPEQSQAKRDVLAGLFGHARTEAILAEDAAGALLGEMSKHPDMAAAVAAAAGQRELGSAESVAQVLQWRLEGLRSGDAERALTGPLPWLPAVPDTAGELRDWAQTQGRAIADRAGALAWRVDAERPAWAVPLGGRPVEPELARPWDRAAALSAAYREQYRVTDDTSILGSTPAGGTQLRGWTAASDAVREWAAVRELAQAEPDAERVKAAAADRFTARPYSEMSDRLLARTFQTCRAQQADAQRFTAEAAAIATEQGLNVKVAEREVAQLADQAAQVRAAAAARAAADALAQADRELRAKEVELAAVSGLFAGGKRKALAAEIEELRAVRDARAVEREAAAAMVRPGPEPAYRGDPSEEAVAERAAQIMAVAQQRDARQVELARWQAQEATAQAEQSAPVLADALAEQRYREEMGITVEDDPAVLVQERLAAEQAERDELDEDYSHEPAVAVEQDGIEM